ncbi:rho GTPase-activating protein 21-like isoform X2 [Dendronephthya gigantea]|uniref:rho GTPase-activating protein 21-like isoform X2 n=1 Tax=Dendronephthya gigantea TaxID=151771 RepID=UPI00106A5B6E|nr:rho GTPase-activating protein 21-like isoform X2 [Dendronephthya gigantea]
MNLLLSMECQNGFIILILNAGRQVIAKHIVNTSNTPVVSSVRCVRIYRRKYGFGLNFKYLYRTNTIMEKRENRGCENLGDECDVSGSDADISGESSDTSSNKDEDDKVDKVFVKWVAPGGPASQAGLMKGDEVININNSAVYGKHASDIDNLLQHSNAVDVDVVEDQTKRRGKHFQRYRENGYEVRVVHRGSQDDLTDHESSDNDNHSTGTGNQYFVVTYGKTSETKGSKSKLHPFLRPTSYSDDEPLMENKSVSISGTKSENSTGRISRYNQESASVRGSKVPGKTSSLTNSISSSVLVESQDPKPDVPVTVTTATYSTLAEPQSTRSDISIQITDSNSCNNALLVSQENGNVWELRVPQATHIRPRSPSPAARRVSYLMATEGNGSGNLEFRSISNGETSDDGLSPFEDENNGQQAGNEQHRTTLHIPRKTSLQEDDNNAQPNEDTEDLNEEKRHSLKRKCSADYVEVDKEGYLKRKYGATHGRRSWKQVYVVLKAHIMYIYKEKRDLMISSGQDEKPISIKSCIVDIAYDYRKRENVFKFTTYNGSQYLFQAKDKDDMMSWIEVIQKNNNPDEDTFGRTSEDLIVRRKKNMDIEISSQTNNKAIPPTSLKIGGLKKSLSFKSNSGSQSSFKFKKAIDSDGGKATWHSKVVNKVRRIGNTTSNPIPQYQSQAFSAVTSLERCPKSKTNSSLPLLVEHCCNVVENKALESIGIYRVPGNSAMVTALEEELNIKTPEDVNFDEPKWNDANNMASLLRNFLRKLPEGLVTSELYARFIDANRIEGDDRMWSLKRLIQQLPSAYGETLRFIIAHLKKVSQHSDKNKMEVRNLAIVFGPTIVRTGEDNMSTMVSDMTDRFRIVESFINNFDWFFDNEAVSEGDCSSSPISPPAEITSPLLMSSKTMNSIEQAAVNYDSDQPWKAKGGSMKLPMFKSFLKPDSSKSSENNKKHEFNPERAAIPEPVDNKTSPVNLSPRYGGNSEPSSPSTNRRKFIKRHHSSTNISMDVYEDFDRSKSEGEDEEHAFYPRPSHSTKAYSYARPPPPSYRESRSKVRAPAGSNTQSSNKDSVVPESAGFSLLSDDTKRRILSFNLRNKVKEKKKQQDETAPHPTTQNGVVEKSRTDSVTVTIPRKLSNSSQTGSSTSDEQIVDQQLSPSESKQQFEQREKDNESSPVKTFSSDAVRRRDGSSSASSSRNFKIYSKGDVTFSQCQQHQINEWMRDLGISPKAGNERGRALTKTEDLGKTLRRSSSVARTSFTQDDEEIIMKRRSLSCQNINIGDEDVTRGRSSSKSSESSESSDEEDKLENSSETFDEKLRGLMQKCKLDSKSKTELQQGRKGSLASRPSSYRMSRTPVQKMRDMDPTSNIQSGAVSSMKSLFETGVAHQQVVKSRSSSVSSASSGSLLSNDTNRKSTSSTLSDADVKRRVWESGDGKSGEVKKQWKEPEWVARERAMKNLNSGSESSFKEQPDNNNNLPKPRDSKMQYSRSTSLPMRDSGYVVKDVVVERKRPDLPKPQLLRKYSADYFKSANGSPIIQRASVKNGPTISKITPASSVQYKPELKTQLESDTAQVSHVQYNPQRPQTENHPVSVSSVKYRPEPNTQADYRSGDADKRSSPHKILGRAQSSPLRSRISSQESTPPASPTVVNYTPDSPGSSVSSAVSPPTKDKSNRSRRRLVSDTTHRGQPETRQSGRTFTAPILGTIVTTTTAFELSAFPNPNLNPNPKTRCVRRSERQDSGGLQGRTRSSNDMSTIPRATLTIPSTSSSPSPSHYGSPSVRRKAAPGLTVPDIDESKRLSTDRTLLEQNALHIKELLDEMNTEHSLKMERQKSDTISIDAQKAARNKARMRRRSLGPDRENGVVVSSRVTSSGAINDRNRPETQATRNVSTVEWVGVSS